MKRTAIITGASRGIGRAIALKLAHEDFNIVIASKSDEPHRFLPGTIHSVAEEVEAVGARALAVKTDVRHEEEIDHLIEKTAETFSSIDVIVNNAGAIDLSPLKALNVKKFDLMNQINARAPYILSMKALPYLEKSKNAHILNLCPPISLDDKWFLSHTAYTMSKYAMTLMTKGLAGELHSKKISVNSLWPKHLINTAAMKLFPGIEVEKHCYKPELVADAAALVFGKTHPECTGQNLLAEDFLAQEGISDLAPYLESSDAELKKDLFVD